MSPLHWQDGNQQCVCATEACGELVPLGEARAASHRRWGRWGTRQCDPNGLKVLLALQGGRNDCFFGRNIKHRNRNNFKQTLKEVERRNSFVLEILFI